MNKKVAVIGGGIVGSCASFYLLQLGYQVDLYDDDGQGQATSAAAGIICPWLSQRRNKAWYRLSCLGAKFYDKLLTDIQNHQLPTTFYKKTGAIVFKDTPEKLEKMYQVVLTRKQQAPEIGELSWLNGNQFPEIINLGKGLLASGGALISGSDMIATLHKACQQYLFRKINKKIKLSDIESQYDAIILACGAWLKQTLDDPLLYVDIAPQKGQLFEFKLSNLDNKHYPLFMPQGELDLLPLDNGRWIVGASHENNKGYDLRVDSHVIDPMKETAQTWLNESITIDKVRVGIRGYTSDFSPFIGQVMGYDNVFAVGGLGSSGLTTGAYLGYLLSLLVDHQEIEIDLNDYPIDRYIYYKNKERS